MHPAQIAATSSTIAVIDRINTQDAENTAKRLQTLLELSALHTPAHVTDAIIDAIKMLQSIADRSYTNYLLATKQAELANEELAAEAKYFDQSDADA